MLEISYLRNDGTVKMLLRKQQYFKTYLADNNTLKLLPSK
jgi:hypothetical protein